MSDPVVTGACRPTPPISKRRPWRIEFRYCKHTTALNERDAYDGWTPWYRHKSAFATREAALRMTTTGDFGWYLSFAKAHQYRIVEVPLAADKVPDA